MSLEPVTVATAGVSSAVYDADGSELGHVVLLDMDDHDRDDVVAVARELCGPAVVCRSSPGSWHIWGLTPRTHGTMMGLLREHSAPEHVRAAEERGQAHLRTHPKLDTSTGEPVTTAPVPVGVYGVGSSRPSAPHLVQLEQLASEHEPGLQPTLELAGVDGTVGRTFSTARYEYEVQP